MIKEFSLNSNSALINFTAKYCKTQKEVLSSDGFRTVLNHYLKSLKKRDEVIYDEMIKLFGTDEIVMDRLTVLFKLLMILDIDEVEAEDTRFHYLLEEKDLIIEFVEKFYNYWRNIDRYALIRNTHQTDEGMQQVNFIQATDDFTNLILKIYRQITETILEKKNLVYRQLSAGVNAGVILNDSKWDAPEEFGFLKDVPFIDSMILRPPFISYPGMNKRTGVFQDLGEAPYGDAMGLDPNHWFCYPAKVGEFLTYVYFHREYMVHGVSLSNLFELAEYTEYEGRNPDMIYIFGSKEFDSSKIGFWHDKKNDIMCAYANNDFSIDYFGYMKKMLLTLHNTKQLKNGFLPIHGAMVNVVLKDGTESNIVIMGDSGAGKSESLEAFRNLSEKYLKSIKIIFDDMGTFKIEDGKLMGYGTEIGAFVRLDDLDTGYAYQEIDRAVFMNPDKINARLIIPVASYTEVMRGYEVDLFLYANNFKDEEDVIQFFDDVQVAKDVFIGGERAAKGTTSEVGIVKSFFANPFGMIQEEELSRQIIDEYFDFMFNNRTKVGEIYTKLGIEGEEFSGPLAAAKHLFEIIKE